MMPPQIRSGRSDGRNRLLAIVVSFAIMPWVGCNGSDLQSALPLPLPRDVAMGFKIEKYSDFSVYEAQLARLKSSYPAGFDYHSDRKSQDGAYPLYWITVGDTAQPVIFFVAVLHAKNEWAGSQMILRDLPGALHVLTIAPQELRIERLAAREGISVEEATQRVHSSDKARGAFHRKFWKADVNDPSLYHITFETSRMPYEIGAELVAGAVRSIVGPA